MEHRFRVICVGRSNCVGATVDMPLLFIILQALAFTSCPVQGTGETTVGSFISRNVNSNASVPIDSNIREWPRVFQSELRHDHLVAMIDNQLLGIKWTMTTIPSMGHGNCTRTTADMPLLFIILQVSRCEGNLKSSSRCIIALPCPDLLLESVLDCWRGLLGLCGDVELNPGPKTRTDKMLTEILENQTKMSSDINSIHRRFDFMDERIAKIETALNKVQDNEEQIRVLQRALNKLENIVASWEKKIVYLEHRGRCNNLVVFGIPEAADESDSELRMKVITEIFEARLDVQVETVECIHRLGRKFGLKNDQ